MALKQKYYAQPDGSTVPDVALTGNPGIDQITLTNANFLGGIIMALKTSATAGRGTVIVPCDAATQLPFGVLLNGPGEFAGAIGPSGSGKAPVLRAMAQFYVDAQAYVASPTAAYAVGNPVYCGTGANKGLFTADAPTAGSVGIASIGIITQVPTAQDPWLGVASKL